MTRTATLLTISFALAASAVVVAAPVPPPSEKEILAKLWGKTEGEGEFELKGKELTLRTTFGKPNASFAWNAKTAAPRTGRTVRGDFEITVRILDAVPPNKDAKHDGSVADTNAGIYLRGENTSIRYQLHQAYQRFVGIPANPNMQRMLRFEANYPRGGATSSTNIPADGKSTWVRLIRKGKDVSMSHSSDGEKWSAPNNPFRNIDMSIPDEVTVGVFLSHSTYQFTHATFDNFTVTKLAEEKPK